MAKKSPQEVAALWAKNFGASGDAYKSGISRVTENPAQLAIAAQDRMVANFTQSVMDGKWSAALGKVSLAGWKQACTEKGAAQLATAARLATEKVARAEATMGPIRDAVRDSLPARGDINANLERARLMALGLHEARRRG